MPIDDENFPELMHFAVVTTQENAIANNRPAADIQTMEVRVEKQRTTTMCNKIPPSLDPKTILPHHRES